MIQFYMFYGVTNNEDNLKIFKDTFLRYYHTEILYSRIKLYRAIDIMLRILIKALSRATRLR